MMWTLLGLTGLVGLLGRIATQRHEHDPHVMPFQTGHFGGYGEAPPGCHHRLGSRNR